MKNEDYFIIANPISGNGKAKNLIKKITTDLENLQKTYKVFKTEYAGHAKKICQQLTAYKKIIIIGGDGTFNEVVNGIMLNKHKPTIGFIPGGTGNSMMHDLNGTQYKQALDIILSNQTKKIDVMKLELHQKIEYSINIVGWGMAADINILAEKIRFLGPPRYTLASMYYVLNKKSRKARIQINGNELIDNFLFILTLNTIHTGKGMKAAPKAKLNDGLIDVVIVKADISKLKLLLLLPRIFTGKHIFSNQVNYIQAKSINIFPDKKEQLNIDGEMKCSTPVSISVLPEELNIFSKN